MLNLSKASNLIIVLIVLNLRILTYNAANIIEYKQIEKNCVK